jgi:ABC-type glycerol-3-phosphate transport system permease component
MRSAIGIVESNTFFCVPIWYTDLGRFYKYVLIIHITQKDLEEAALVDGASLFGIYWRIVLPLSRSVFATVVILQFLVRWNDFLRLLMVTRGETYRPLMVLFGGISLDA